MKARSIFVPGVFIGGLQRIAAAQERLEEARRLEDAELDLFDLAAAQPHIKRALALDAGQGIDLDDALSHATGSPWQSPAPRR